MNRRVPTRLALVAFVYLLAVAPSSATEPYRFQHATGITVDVLSREEFAATFEPNPAMPLTDVDVVAMAQRLYPPAWEVGPAADNADVAGWCRESEVGVLFAALSNPDISDATRQEVDRIVADATPPLPRTFSSGHFVVHYTDHDPNPDHNVTLAKVRQLATTLNANWTTYARDFRAPKHYVSRARQVIDIKVYSLGPNSYGETSSYWNYISINSKAVMSDQCLRKLTCAHELFHRVQYSYGYVSGTADMGWMTEGTAIWSEAYTNRAMRNYLAYMNDGLANPDVALLTARSYDASPLWVYLERRATWRAIRDTWAAYNANGLNGKAALDTVVSSALDLNFDAFIALWSKANYIKDLSRAGKYDYLEDEVVKTSCNVTYGPLAHVPRTTGAIAAGAVVTRTGDVQAYGADYYEFTIALDVSALEIDVTGDNPLSDFTFHFIGMKGRRALAIVNAEGSSHTFMRTLTSGEWDRIAVVVVGLSGGSYTLTTGHPVLPGAWNILEAHTYPGPHTASSVWRLAPAANGYSVLGTRQGVGTVVGSARIINSSPPSLWVDLPGYGDYGCVGGNGQYSYQSSIDPTLMEGHFWFFCPDGTGEQGTFSARKRPSTGPSPIPPMSGVNAVGPN